MRNTSSLFVGICAFLVLFMPGLCHAAEEKEPPSNMPAVRKALRKNKKLFIAQHLDLTVSETNLFWSVYDGFQKELEKIIGQYSRLMKELARTRDTMTDSDAIRLLNKRLSLDAEYLRLSESYLPKFMKVLPGRKVIRYYRLESKFYAVVKYDLAEQIPLLE